MRLVIVGSGVIGLLTAMECVRAGGQVILVDQATIPSPWATSHDRQRVIRALHRGDAALTRAAAPVHREWLDIQRRLGARFYHQVGVLTAMAAQDTAANLALLGAAGVSARALPSAELAVRYPRIRFPAGTAAIFEPAAGAIQADRALQAMARWLRDQPGVQFYPCRRVVGIGERATVRLAGGTVLAGDRVVVAAGPWSRDLLPAAMHGDVTLFRQTMLSYAPGAAREVWAGTPAVLGLGPARDAWMMPPVADTPARLSAASACRPVPEMTDLATPSQWRDHLTTLFSGLLAGFDPAYIVGAADGYYLADTVSGGPLLTAVSDGTVWSYAACGGMSFKFAPVIARAIAAHAMAQPARLTGLAAIDQPRLLTAARRGGAA